MIEDEKYYSINQLKTVVRFVNIPLTFRQLREKIISGEIYRVPSGTGTGTRYKVKGQWINDYVNKLIKNNEQRINR